MSLLPYTQGNALTNALEEIHNFFNRSAPLHLNTAFTPRFDVHETDTAYKLDGELPGVKQKDIEVEFIESGTLNIKGHIEHESSSGSREGRSFYSERSMGDFRRCFRFPAPIDEDRVEAKLKNGVLSITVPKTGAVAAGKRIEVQ